MKILTFDKAAYRYYQNLPVGTLEKLKLEIVWIDPKALERDDTVKVLISGRVTEDNIDRLPNLEMVIVPFTGYDGLDLQALEKRNIFVTNTSAHGPFVAERALALTLALRGNLVSNHIALTKGDWSGRYSSDTFRWSSLFHKKVGIYGYGTIGQSYKSMVEAFNVKVGTVAYKNRSFDGLEVFDDLTALCEWCDVLVITVPLTPKTEGSIDKVILSKMSGKQIINVARGSVVNEEALFHSLKEGVLSGYASDVWYNYPTKDKARVMPSSFPFESLDHVVMTPHNAGFEMMSRQVRYEDVLAKIVTFVKAEDNQ